MPAAATTKELMNFLTTAVMERIGKLRGPHMVDMACLNDKLNRRAVCILRDLFGLSEEEARSHFQRHSYRLRAAVEALENS